MELYILELGVKSMGIMNNMYRIRTEEGPDWRSDNNKSAFEGESKR